MELFNLLKPEAVKVISTVSSKKRLLHSIGELAQSVHGLDAAKTVAALQERETLGPTGVGSGVALPHARSAQIDRVVGTFILLEKPVELFPSSLLPGYAVNITKSDNGARWVGGVGLVTLSHFKIINPKIGAKINTSSFDDRRSIDAADHGFLTQDQTNVFYYANGHSV